MKLKPNDVQDGLLQVSPSSFALLPPSLPNLFRLLQHLSSISVFFTGLEAWPSSGPNIVIDILYSNILTLSSILRSEIPIDILGAHIGTRLSKY